MFDLLDSKDSQIELLTQELKTERAKLGEALKKSGTYEMQIKLLENELNQLINENQELKQKLETQRIKLSRSESMGQQNAELQDQVERLQDKLQDLEGRYEGVSQAHRSLQQISSDQQKQLEHKNCILTKVTNDLEDAEYTLQGKY